MLKIAEKILNGENPTLCFFGDSVTHGEFEFTNGYKESVQKPELVYHKLLADRIRETYGKDFTVINAGVGGNFAQRNQTASHESREMCWTKNRISAASCSAQTT